MSKAVLMSVQPKWCEKICHKIGENADGSPIYEKRVEVRKTRPKLDTSFPVYIYQTKKTWVYNIFSKIADWQGKVIGEFICDDITKIINCGSRFVAEGRTEAETNRIARSSCLDFVDMEKYLGAKEGYAWHISNLVIYDEPKELSEFTGLRNTKFGYEPIKITRPPQSWCYVEELSE